MSYKATGIDEIDGFGYRDAHMHPVRHHFGISAFGTNAWTADVGGRLVPDHDQDDGEEELYVVVRGRARFEIGDATVDAPAGTLLFVPPGLRRTAFAEEQDTAVLAVGAMPGEPYEPNGWEVWAPAHDLYEAGDDAGVVERVGAEVAAAGYGLPLYNLACCEALAGMKEDAMEDLRSALERSPDLREFARTDSDLEAIRDAAGFEELVGEAK